jgi:hypothetical protein
MWTPKCVFKCLDCLNAVLAPIDKLYSRLKARLGLTALDRALAKNPRGAKRVMKGKLRTSLRFIAGREQQLMGQQVRQGCVGANCAQMQPVVWHTCGILQHPHEELPSKASAVSALGMHGVGLWGGSCVHWRARCLMHGVQSSAVPQSPAGREPHLPEHTLACTHTCLKRRLPRTLRTLCDMLQGEERRRIKTLQRQLSAAQARNAGRNAEEVDRLQAQLDGALKTVNDQTTELVRGAMQLHGVLVWGLCVSGCLGAVGGQESAAGSSVGHACVGAIWGRRVWCCMHC